jgi:hypothetical protein
LRNFLTSLACGNLPQVVEVEDAPRQPPLRPILPLDAVMLRPKGDALPAPDGLDEAQDRP